MTDVPTQSGSEPSPGFPRAALLAGGFGTRIRAVGGSTPKVLLPVEGRPFIAHVLEYLEREGVREVVLCLGHAADQIWDAAQSQAPGSLTLIASPEATPLGTGGAVANALDHLGSTFFVINGDTYLEAPLRTLLAAHQEKSSQLTLSLVRSERAAEKGTVRVAPDGRLLEFAEKVESGTGLINAGSYVCESSFFAGREPDTALSLETELIPDALARGETLIGVTLDAPFIDIGLPEDYLAVRDRLPRSGGGW